MWNLKKFESILQVKDFCHNECISLSRFFYWQKKLKQDRKELEAPSGFVPLALNPIGSPAKYPPDYSHLAVRLVLSTPPADRVGRLEEQIKELKEYIEEVFADYNDINDDTRMQIELGKVIKLNRK